MIINAFIGFAAYILDITFRLVDGMGNFLLPDGIADFITEMLRLGFVFNELFPVTELYLLLATVITFEIWVAGYKVTLWVYEQVRHMVRS